MMPGLPKIVIERLKAKAAAPKGAEDGHEPAALEGGAHPDANLLAAFVEKTLAEKERSQVLTHLAQCAECREATVLALPAEVEAAQPARRPARRGWSAWQTLRWGALAAALGAVAVVVFLHPWAKQETATKETRSTEVASVNKPAPQPPVVLVPPQPSATVTLPKKEAASRESAREMAKPQTAAALEHERAADQLTTTESTSKVSVTAAAPPVLTTEGQAGAAAGLNNRVMRGQGALAARALPAPPSAPSPAAPPSVESKSTLKTAASGEPQAAALAAPAATPSAQGAGGFAGTAGKTSAKGYSVGGPQQLQTLRAESQSLGLSRMALRKETQNLPSPALPFWTISSTGKVQRSEDSSKTPEDVYIADGITFRVVTANGAEVWAGGSAGALYHSSDGGASWKRVTISAAGSALSETIVGIRSVSPQHVAVTTESGENWVSEDGGQHWQKAP